MPPRLLGSYWPVPFVVVVVVVVVVPDVSDDAGALAEGVVSAGVEDAVPAEAPLSPLAPELFAAGTVP